LRDAAGNTSVAITDDIYLLSDGSAPNVSSVVIRDAGTGVDNATFTGDQTVTLVISYTETGTGIDKAIVTDNATIANNIVAGTWTSTDNLTGSSGYSLLTSSNFTDNGTAVVANGTINTDTQGSKDLWAFLVDGGGNLSTDNRSDAIFYDNASPEITISLTGSVDNLTAGIDNTTYTGSLNLSILLDYNDNLTVQYYISESDLSSTTISTNQYTDDMNSAIDGGMLGISTSGIDNATAFNDNLTNSFWSILDNKTGDNASTYVVGESYNKDNQTISFTLSSGDGLRTVYAWAKDAANNISLVASDNITVDTTGPVQYGSLNIVDNATAPTQNLSVTTSTAVQIDNTSVLFSDGGIGVHRLFFTDNSSKTPTAGEFDRVPNGSLSDLTFTFTMDNGSGSLASGDYMTLYAWAIDNMSNISSAVSTTFQLDNESPADSSGVLVVNNSSGVYNADNQTFYISGAITLSFDNASGALATDTSLIYYAVIDNTSTPSTATFNDLDRLSLTLADNATVYVWAMDALQQTSAASLDNLSIVLDNVSPADSSGVLIVNNGSGVYTTDNQTFYISGDTTLSFDNASGTLATDTIPISYAVTDGTSAPSTSAFNDLNNLSLAVTDNATVYVWAMDALQNVSAANLDNLSIVLDNLAPSTAIIDLYNPSDNTTDNITAGNTVKVGISAGDSLAGVTAWYVTDNSTTPTTSSNWTNFSSAGTNISENVIITFDNSSIADNGTVVIYAWVMDGVGNISAVDSDNITYYH